MRHLRWLALLALFGCSEQLFPTPVPQPQPTPIVDPQPVPIGDVAFLYVLEESSQRTPEIAAVLLDQWWHDCKIPYRMFDKDAEGIEDIVKAVGSTTLPAIVVVPKTGKPVVKALPATIDGVKELVK